MATSLQEKLESMLQKISELETLCDMMRSDKESLEDENARLHAENIRLRGEVKAAGTDIEFLKVSHRLASSPDEIIKARRHLAGLIRDLDKCIAQLKE